MGLALAHRANSNEYPSIDAIRAIINVRAIINGAVDEPSQDYTYGARLEQ